MGMKIGSAGAVIGMMIWYAGAMIGMMIHRVGVITGAMSIGMRIPRAGVIILGGVGVAGGKGVAPVSRAVISRAQAVGPREW